MTKNVQELTKSPGLYWDKFEIAFKIFRLMGYIPYKNCDGNNKIESSTQAWMWVAFAGFVQVVTVLTSDYMHFDDKYWDTYDKTLKTLIRLLNTNNVIFILATWWESNKIVNYVNRWDEFIKKLENITTTPVSCFSKNTLKCILICVGIIVLAVVLLDQFLLQGGFNPFLLFSYFINVYVSALFTIFWATNCIFIVQLAQFLRKHFFIALKTSDHLLLEQYRLLWIQLRLNAFQLPESFKGSIGIIIFMNLVSLIFSIYTWMTAVVYGKDLNQVIGLVIPVVWNAVTLMIICEFSDLVSQEIGKKLRYKLLSINTTAKNYALIKSDEFDSVLDMLDAKATDFVLHGCVNLNRSLLIKMLSSIVTYTIVLVQFDVSGKTNIGT